MEVTDQDDGNAGKDDLRQKLKRLVPYTSEKTHFKRCLR